MILAGVITLYNPDKDVVGNLLSYASFLGHFYIFDNSPSPHEDIKEKVEKTTCVTYFWTGENKGIAACLNQALQLADKEGFQWLLTMDQDSRFMTEHIPEYLSCLSKADENVYGICPTFQEELKRKAVPNSILSEVKSCVTSGNIVRVKLAMQCGGYNESLFIDEVDLEFCYRCNKAGYKLYKYNKVIFSHHVGDPIHKCILGFHFTALNESYIRQYYIMRNRLYVCDKYPEVRTDYYWNIIKWMIKILLAEPDKYRKFKYALKGWRDYNHRRFGSLKL